MSKLSSRFKYAQPVTKKGVKKDTAEVTEEKKLSNHAQRHLEEKKKGQCCVFTPYQEAVLISSFA